MRRIGIIGAGDLGQLIAYHAINDSGFEVVGFFDDTLTSGTLINNIKVLGNINDITYAYANKMFDGLMIAIGYKHMDFRKSIFDKYNKDIPFASIVHSSCYIDPSCSIGKGVFILPGTTLDKGCVIGNNVLLNTGVVIAHDSTVKEHSFIAPAVKIAGFTTVGAKCFIGINATILNNLSVCDEVLIGAGGLVNKSINIQGTYIGIPVKLKS